MTFASTKTQISLGIRPVLSESSLSAWRSIGSLATHKAHSEDSDQTAQFDLSLRWAQNRQFVDFCHAAAQFINNLPFTKPCPDRRCACLRMCVRACVRPVFLSLTFSYYLRLRSHARSITLAVQQTLHEIETHDSHHCIVNVLKKWNELHVSICHLKGAGSPHYMVTGPSQSILFWLPW